ncbi:MAG: hypothetical protein R2864_08910 [Syntrophotaleaceae bacterium]
MPKSERVKHNPLQRITYLGIVSLLVPFQMGTGFIYYYYSRWPQLGWDWTLVPSPYCILPVLLLSWST